MLNAFVEDVKVELREEGYKLEDLENLPSVSTDGIKQVDEIGIEPSLDQQDLMYNSSISDASSEDEFSGSETVDVPSLHREKRTSPQRLPSPKAFAFNANGNRSDSISPDGDFRFDYQSPITKAPQNNPAGFPFESHLKLKLPRPISIWSSLA